MGPSKKPQTGSAQSPQRPLSPAARATAERILDAAQTCFAERGYSGTPLRRIAERAGVTQPLVSHYFESKDRLFEAVLERSIREYELVQAEQFALAHDDPDFFLVGLAVLFRWLGTQREIMRLIQWARLEDRLPDGGFGVEIWARVRTRARALVEAGIMRDDIDLDGAMLFIDALMKGFWDRSRHYSEMMRAGDDRAEVLERTCERTFLLGLVRAFFAPDYHATAEARLAAILERSGPLSPRPKP